MALSLKWTFLDILYCIYQQQSCLSPLLAKEKQRQGHSTAYCRWRGSVSWKKPRWQTGCKQLTVLNGSSSLLNTHIFFIISDPESFRFFLVSGAQAAQCKPLFASNAQQHHPQSGSSNSPPAGWSVEHGADGSLPGRSQWVHGCGGSGGAEPVRSHRRGAGGNRTLPATGAAGGRRGGQGEVNTELHYMKLSPLWLIFDFLAF